MVNKGNSLLDWSHLFFLCKLSLVIFVCVFQLFQYPEYTDAYLRLAAIAKARNNVQVSLELVVILWKPFLVFLYTCLHLLVILLIHSTRLFFIDWGCTKGGWEVPRCFTDAWRFGTKEWWLGQGKRNIPDCKGLNWCERFLCCSLSGT